MKLIFLERTDLPNDRELVDRRTSPNSPSDPTNDDSTGIQADLPSPSLAERPTFPSEPNDLPIRPTDVTDLYRPISRPKTIQLATPAVSVELRKSYIYIYIIYIYYIIYQGIIYQVYIYLVHIYIYI